MTFKNIIPPSFIEPAFFDNFLSVSATENFVKNSVSNFELETVDLHDAMYNINVIEVISTEYLSCNKRISNEGQQWSAGRPGNRPMAARDAAQNSDTYLGAYATCDCVQSPLVGHKTRGEIQASSRRTQGEDQDITNQPIASSSRRFAVEDHTSPVMAVLHPRRPPYFSRGANGDVYVWTSIVDCWLSTVQGKPSKQLIYFVSLLRGAAFEWLSSVETCTRCWGDWTTLRQAMLKRFRSSIRKKKACVALLQLTQDKMTVLRYADAFESYLAQLEYYGESFYLTKFFFGLCSTILTEGFAQRPTILLEAKKNCREAGIDSNDDENVSDICEGKDDQNCSIEAPRRGDLKGCISHFS